MENDTNSADGGRRATVPGEGGTLTVAGVLVVAPLRGALLAVTPLTAPGDDGEAEDVVAPGGVVLPDEVLFEHVDDELLEHGDGEQLDDEGLLEHGGGVLVLGDELPPVQPVCAGFVLPMPLLPSHS